MEKRVSDLETPEECDEFVAEALQNGQADLAREARERSIALRVERNPHGASSDPEREAVAAVYAYETAKSEAAGRRVFASRTWSMFPRHGILGTVERTVNRTRPTPGYATLVEAGLEKYAFEAVVLRYPERFSSECVERARHRLENWRTESAMPVGIPHGITRQLLLDAIAALDRGTAHLFGKSIDYDVLHNDRRYAPKPVVGLAAQALTGTVYGPRSFTGGIGSKCFRVLRESGFTIITKGPQSPFPDEVNEEEDHTEGDVARVTVNRYERDKKARAKCIKYYGATCTVCDFDFRSVYGVIGEGFIHVHHTVPLSRIGKAYKVDPISDLKPVCPNCHAMLHRRKEPEPYSIEEMRAMLESTRNE